MTNRDQDQRHQMPGEKPQNPAKGDPKNQHDPKNQQQHAQTPGQNQKGQQGGQHQGGQQGGQHGNPQHRDQQGERRDERQR